VDIEIGIGYKSRWPEQQMARLPENNFYANNLDEIQRNVDSIETGKENPPLPENHDKWIGNLAPAERAASSPSAGCFHISGRDDGVVHRPTICLPS